MYFIIFYFFQLKKVAFYWPRWPRDQKNKKIILPTSPNQFENLESVTLIFQSHQDMPNQDIFNFVGSCSNLKTINVNIFFYSCFFKLYDSIFNFLFFF